MLLRVRAAIVFLFAFLPVCLATDLSLLLVPEPVVRTRLERGKVHQRERQSLVKDLFLEAGCQPEEKKVDKHYSNVVCTLKGETDDAIVVGGHYDFVDAGDGIVDDWSGTALLSSLYEMLSKQPRHHTFIFVAFAKEEAGLVGSSRYVKELSTDERAHVRAFVNIECLGLTPLKVWQRRANPELLKRLTEAAGALHYVVPGINVDRVGNDDSQPFVNAKIPCITLHSLTQETWPILHNRRDNLQAIHPDEYYAAYHVIALYLAYLNLKLT